MLYACPLAVNFIVRVKSVMYFADIHDDREVAVHTPPRVNTSENCCLRRDAMPQPMYVLSKWP